jgi:hypothetical protein
VSEIAFIGVDADPVAAHFLAECRVAGFEVAGLNLREVARSGGWRIAAPEDGSSVMWAGDGGPRVELGRLRAVYCRPVGLAEEELDPRFAVRWKGLMASVLGWLHAATCLVVNDPEIHVHNSAKPLHEALLAARGFDVPPSITTSDPEAVAGFLEGGRAVVKACSGVRGHAREIVAADLEGYEPAHGPLHVQRLIVGDDVRAHVVGEEVHAVRIVGDAVDYRRGAGSLYSAWDPPDDLAAELVRSTAELGLSFAGWDLKIDRGEQPWALEVNPMPGYSDYDHYVGGAISHALMGYLEAGVRPPARTPGRPRAA